MSLTILLSRVHRMMKRESCNISKDAYGPLVLEQP